MLWYPISRKDHPVSRNSISRVRNICHRFGHNVASVALIGAAVLTAGWEYIAVCRTTKPSPEITSTQTCVH